MLLITPRTFFIGGVGGGVGLLSRRGIISGSQGGASIIGVGSRPWLQKVAALTVAISLTIATADTFSVAQRQYALGIENADDLRVEVANSVQIKVSRVISDIFLWLAQVQTLIRLFPRHKEKVLIKWIGFALIVLDTTFSCLNSFSPLASPQQTKLSAAIPALSSLFQLALSLLYASWVLYYVWCKRRYAFYHALMWNVSIVAILSIVAIATPVVFFITDLANPSIAGWGDYFRWVGAAGASVIVWEWVERIEALEREEKKDGILGTEVFDGDDSDDDLFDHHRRRRRGRGLWIGSENAGIYASGFENGVGPRNTPRPLQRLPSGFTSQSGSQGPAVTFNITDNRPFGLAVPSPPPQTVSPISRTDTASAASTVYAVQYNTLNIPTPPVFKKNLPNQRNRAAPSEANIPESAAPVSERGDVEADTDADAPPRRRPEPPPQQSLLASLGNPFKRRRIDPPAEVRQGQVIDPVSLNEPMRQQPIHKYETWDLKGRLGAFAAEKGEKLRDWSHSQHQKVEDLPVTIIPAQRRPGPAKQPWSPEDTVQDAAQPSPPSKASLLSPDDAREDLASSTHEAAGVDLAPPDSPRASTTPSQPEIGEAGPSNFAGNEETSRPT
jgi:PalH/RIM21